MLITGHSLRYSQTYLVCIVLLWTTNINIVPEVKRSLWCKEIKQYHHINTELYSQVLNIFVIAIHYHLLKIHHICIFKLLVYDCYLIKNICKLHSISFLLHLLIWHQCILCSLFPFPAKKPPTDSQPLYARILGRSAKTNDPERM